MDEEKHLLESAYKLHINGDLIQAKALYEIVLSNEPDNLEAVNLYAQLSVSLKDYDKAIDLFYKIYEKYKITDILINIAKVYTFKKDYVNAKKVLSGTELNIDVLKILSFCEMQTENYKEALKYFKMLIDIKPDGIFYYNISLCCRNLDLINDSLNYAEKALALLPNDVDILIHTAYLYEKLNNDSKLEETLLKILNINHSPDIYFRLGVLYKKQGKHQKAVEFFDNVLKITPDNKAAMLNIASSYKYIDIKNCIEIYNEILQMYPDDINVLFCVYKIYFDIFDFKNALSYALKLIEKDEKCSVYYLMAADSYMAMYKYKEAIEYYKMSLKYNSENDDAKRYLAFAYSCMRDDKNAVKILQSLAQTPEVQKDITVINLRNRNFERVKEGYFNWLSEIKEINEAKEQARENFYVLNVGEKYGISEEDFTKFRVNITTETYNKINKFREKLLKNEDFHGKNLLIYSAHGTGDAVMMSRYLNIIKDSVKNLLLFVPQSLKNLVEYNFPYAKVYSDSDNIDENEYDYSGTFMDLLYYTTKSLTDIPYSDGYLNVAQSNVLEKSKLNIFDFKSKKIGLFWQGNPSILRNRSIEPKYFIPLFELNKYKFYSFQLSNIDEGANKIKNDYQIIDLLPYISNYTDTAALLKNIDILITIDTSIAHLAGAMGIRTYLLLPYYADWRWFHNEEKTQWYNSIRIFKQKEPNDWQSVINEVNMILENEL